MSFFHSFTHYCERRWVSITRVQCILQMIKFNKHLKQKYGCILFHWLRGFCMVDYKTFQERYCNCSIVEYPCPKTFLTDIQNTLYSPVNTDIRKITPCRELNPYLFCHVPSRKSQQCDSSCHYQVFCHKPPNFFSRFLLTFSSQFQSPQYSPWLNVWEF